MKFLIELFCLGENFRNNFPAVRIFTQKVKIYEILSVPILHIDKLPTAKAVGFHGASLVMRIAATSFTTSRTSIIARAEVLPALSTPSNKV